MRTAINPILRLSALASNIGDTNTTLFEDLLKVFADKSYDIFRKYLNKLYSKQVFGKNSDCVENTINDLIYLGIYLFIIKSEID